MAQNLTCTPQALAAAAGCFDCLTQKQHLDVQTYLLAQIALASGAITNADPKALVNAANAFRPLNVDDSEAVQIFLLCKLANK